MTNTETERRAAEIFALRSVRDTAVIFATGTNLPDTSRFFEKVGEDAVTVPQARARELSRMLLDADNDGLIEVGQAVHAAPTIRFSYRFVMLTPAGQAVLRAAGA